MRIPHRQRILPREGISRATEQENKHTIDKYCTNPKGKVHGIPMRDGFNSTLNGSIDGQGEEQPEFHRIFLTLLGPELVAALE